MKTKEILAAIHQMEEQLATLKSLVVEEETPIEETISKEEDITLPDPPAEVEVNIPEDTTNTPSKRYMTHDEEVQLGCSIINTLPDFYKGKCSYLILHKEYKDYGKPKFFINKHKVVITAYDINGKPLGSITTAWDNLKEEQIPLINMGINTHKGSKWQPTEVVLSVE